MRLSFFILVLLVSHTQGITQNESPQNMFATYGNMADMSCGDDDFSQILFFAIPKAYAGDFFIRVYDPDCGGMLDKANGLWETNTIFEIYGGKGCISANDARNANPAGNYKSGKVLDQALFARESVLDGKWYAFGPYKSEQGEVLDEYPGYTFFKMVVEGRTGNDGNIYALSVSKERNKNVTLDYSEYFGYELTWLNKDEVITSHPEFAVTDEDKILIPIDLVANPDPAELRILVEPIDE